MIHAFFYKNKLYKNTGAQIWPKIKNKLRKAQPEILKCSVLLTDKMIGQNISRQT